MKKGVLLLLALLAGGGAVAGYPSLRRRWAERDYCAQVVDLAGRGEFDLMSGVWERFRDRLGEPWPDCIPPKGGLRPDDPEFLVSSRSYAKVLTILEPSGLVPDGRPTFRWLAPPGERRYRVNVMSRAIGPVLDREATGTELPYPTEADALRPGFEYLVTVRDLDNSFTAGNVGIKIAWGDKAKEAERALLVLRDRLGEGPAYDFFAGLLYLVPRDEARRFPGVAARRFEALAERYPDSRLLHEILARTYARLGAGSLVQRELAALRRIDGMH
ncbi:MAG TPA: hypothetical protein VKF62_05685 [Planctomycetota bacterium]|nr:hypothetical protein [Planctomycetota bacterium]